jgi:hypothetical protein
MAALPLILVAAVVQGWALYGLNHALDRHHWPATNAAWMFALYAVALFVPTALQLLAEYARAAVLWVAIAVLALVYFYFGWHFGAHVAFDSFKPAPDAGYVFLAFAAGVLWLHVLPFMQNRLVTGRIAPQYPVLFASAWRNALVLAEAGAFTGLFWLLLLLWQMLFHMLGQDFFRDLFQKPIFIYPVTSLTFGCAVHLIGSVEKMTSTVLEQILSLLKWLAVIAGVILAFFTVALLFNLPNLVFSGQKAIGAAWLLWLVAVMVLLLNAAYRDGTVAKPYPVWIAQPLRAIVPLLTVISVTALYALYVRTRSFGLTVERVWALVTAGGAILYSFGYTAAVFRRGAWLGSIARVNIAVALALIVVLTLAFTPVLSPYRLAADSQYQRVVSGVSAQSESPLLNLRFHAGGYGIMRLQQLARIDDVNIRVAAAAMLAQDSPLDAPALPTDTAARLRRLPIYPAGRQLDQRLIDAVIADLNKPEQRYMLGRISDLGAGAFVDLKGDKTEEFVLVFKNKALAYENRQGEWVSAGTMFENPDAVPDTTTGTSIADDVARGLVSVSPPKLNDLMVGKRRYRLP